MKRSSTPRFALVLVLGALLMLGGCATTLNNGGTIAPGVASPGVAGTTLHATSLMWNGGGTLQLQLGAVGDELKSKTPGCRSLPARMTVTGC